MSCPICAKDTDAKYRPFCSRRCADVDLGKWLTGSYVIPGGNEEDPDEIDAAIEEENAAKTRPH
ncbi:MAG: DNA gyrase inhibitor YacG [Paracoccaceae bacterium]